MFPSVPQNTQPPELRPTVMAPGFPLVWHLQDSRCESLGTQYNLFILLFRFSSLSYLTHKTKGFKVTDYNFEFSTFIFKHFKTS